MGLDQKKLWVRAEISGSKNTSVLENSDYLVEIAQEAGFFLTQRVNFNKHRASIKRGLQVGEGRSWYVVQSKPQKEPVVCAQLARISDRVESFFPKIKDYRGIRPLFPSYLFIWTCFSNLENYQLIKYTRGLLRIVGTREDGPIPVSLEAVEIIRNRVDSSGLINQGEMYTCGSSVRVRRGPLKDLMGILERPVSNEGRVQVLFRLLKYPLRAVLRFEDLTVC